MRERIMAICYDFDKTLAPDDMQSFTFIPSVGMTIDEFWEESDKLASDTNLRQSNRHKERNIVE